MNTLRAGVAEVNVTPPVGCELTGFGNRTHGSLGVHDDLFAKALVLDDGRRRAVIITSDNLGLAPDTVADIRRKAHAQFAVPPHALMINSSHTHSGPSTLSLRLFEPRDDSYLALFVRHVLGAISSALNNLVEIKWGTAREPVQIGVNRREMTPDRGTILGRNPLGPLAPYVDVLRLDRLDGSPLAVLFSTAAHPVSQGENNYLISADFPGYAMRAVSSLMGDYAPAPPVAMFAQGCCGNINTIEVGASWDVTRRLGVILGAAVVKCAEAITTRPGGSLAALSHVVQMPLERQPSISDARREMASAKAHLDALSKTQPNRAQLRMASDLLELAHGRLQLAHEGDLNRVVDFELHGIALVADPSRQRPSSAPHSDSPTATDFSRDVLFLGMPGEVFVDYALHIDRYSPFHHNFVFGYTNGCLGYVPTAYAYSQGGYEVDSAFRIWRLLRFDPSSDPLLHTSLRQLLASLWTCCANPV